MARKNQARLQYKEHFFYIWQDENSNWYYSLGDTLPVNTLTKELQPALNMAHESIDEKFRRKAQQKSKRIYNKHKI